MAGVLTLLVILALALLYLAYHLWRRAQALQATLGLPRGEVVYEDLRDARPPDGPLVSHTWHLTGKPDLLVKEGGAIVPVEVKSMPLPRHGRPYPGHVLQLAAYCLLVEDVYGQRPPYGYLRYRDKTLRVPFTDEVRAQVLETLAAMRTAAAAPTVARSHADPWRCARCGLAYVCGPERLT